MMSSQLYPVGINEKINLLEDSNFGTNAAVNVINQFTVVIYDCRVIGTDYKIEFITYSSRVATYEWFRCKMCH